MTTVEYLETPETVFPHELAYGDLRVAESPTISHQRVVLNLSLAMAAFVRDRAIGEVIVSPMDVILDFEADLVAQPDVMYVSRERSHIVRDRIYGAPDLVVEVLSLSTRIGKLDEHLAWFARYGVRECWLASLPQRSLEIIGFEAGAMTRRTVCVYEDDVVSDVLPGLALKPVDVLGLY